MLSEGRAAENPMGSVADLSEALDGLDNTIPQLRSFQSGSTLGCKGPGIWLEVVSKDKASLDSPELTTSKPARLSQALFWRKETWFACRMHSSNVGWIPSPVYFPPALLLSISVLNTEMPLSGR